MAKADFYMAYVSRKKEVDYETLEAKMNLSLDWYRVNDSLWILYTTSNHEKWYSRLKPLCNYVFVCRLDTDQRQGWMKKAFWRWLKREKT